MKVYAEYFDDGSLFYRKNTLLKFGDSWDLIGSVVLANPGSADPSGRVPEDALSLINKFMCSYRHGDEVSLESWHEFSVDPTMRFVEKIFNGWYCDRSEELNGVIQLFNTFNVKNQNLSQAVSQLGGDSELFSRNIHRYFNDQKTYFGFSGEVLGNEILRGVAEQIFDSSSDKIKEVYNSKFSANSFYHPMYINKAYKQAHFERFKKDVLCHFSR